MSPPWMKPRHTTVWCAAADEVTARRRSGGARFRRRHETAAGVIASAEKSVRTAVGGCRRKRGCEGRKNGSGDRRRERGHKTAAGCVALVHKASFVEGRGAGPAAVNHGDGCG